ncbi:hypothetical protein V8E51_009295 [Hyaloscypha variabilis]
MSSSSRPYWHEQTSSERAAGSSLQCPSCKCSSAKRRQRIILGPRARFLATIARSAGASMAFAITTGSAIIIQSYEPWHSRRLDVASMNGERGSLSKEAGSILPICLDKLARLGQTVGKQNEILGNMAARLNSLLDTLHIPQLLEDPPPRLFLAACLSFAFAIASLQHLYKADIYLSRILVMGLIVGCALAFQTKSLMMGLKTYLVWSIILALLLSVVVHWAMKFWQEFPELDDGVEEDANCHDKSCDGMRSRKDDVLKASQH